MTICTNYANAAIIYASGQRLISTEPGVHDDLRENFIFAIDSETGVATPVSPQTSGLPAALAGTSNGRILGFEAGQLVEVAPFTARIANLGDRSSIESTGFDILAGDRGFLIPFDSNFNTQQLYSLDLSNGSTTPIGSTTAVGDAIDNARGTPLGTANPFIISLGSLGSVVPPLQFPNRLLLWVYWHLSVLVARSQKVDLSDRAVKKTKF